MPRKSSAALSVVRSRIDPGPKPPEPPRDLNRPAANLWRAIAQDRPADWFTPATERLLQRFCRTAVYAERLHDALDDEPVGGETAALLFKQIMAANASLGILAAKMRLSTQAAIDGRSRQAGARANGKKPWEM
jgi:hypothetical protein